MLKTLAIVSGALIGSAFMTIAPSAAAPVATHSPVADDASVELAQYFGGGYGPGYGRGYGRGPRYGRPFGMRRGPGRGYGYGRGMGRGYGPGRGRGGPMRDFR